MEKGKIKIRNCDSSRLKIKNMCSTCEAETFEWMKGMQSNNKALCKSHVGELQAEMCSRRGREIFLLFAFRCFINFFISDWSSGEHGQVQRQLSVSSDSKLLDDDIREESRVIMRPKKPPRPKSEVFLNKHDPHPRRKRFSAFGVSLRVVFSVFFCCVRKWRNFRLHNPQSSRVASVNIYIFITTNNLSSGKTFYCFSLEFHVGWIGKICWF